MWETAQIASLKDFRGQGAPADVGLYQFAATAMVFQFDFSGTTFTVAMASGVGGWTLIAQLPTGTDGVIIQAAVVYVEALGGGKVLIGIGEYTITATITAETGIFIIGSGKVGPESGAIHTGCTTLVGANGVNMFEFNVGGAKIFGGGIRDLTIALDAATMGIIVDNICQFIVDNLHIRQGANTYENAIEFRNDAYYSSIRNTFIHDFTVYGVRVLSNMVILDSLWIEQNENGSAFVLIQGCSETRVVNSKFETHPPGLINFIEIEDGYRIIIANNKFSGGYGHTTFGIYVSETGAGLTYEIIIDGNIFDREMGSHITLWEAGDRSIISNNTFKDGGGEDGNLVPIFKFRTVYRLVFSNNNLESGNDFATHGILAENPYAMIIAGNYLRHDGTMPTVELSGSSLVVNIVNNIIDCTVSTYALNAGNNVLQTMIIGNNISTGGLRVASVGSVVFHNRVEGAIVILDGVIVAAIRGEFPLSNIGGGATAVAPVINTSPGGVDIDAADEFAHIKIPLPTEVQRIIRIRIWAYSNVIEATNNMLLRIVAHGAGSGVLWSGNPIDVVDHPSVEEGGIVQYTVLHWVVDSGDDAQIGTLAAQDFVELLAVGEGASAPDIATDILAGGWEIEYV